MCVYKHYIIIPECQNEVFAAKYFHVCTGDQLDYDDDDVYAKLPSVCLHIYLSTHQNFSTPRKICRVLN